MLSIKRLTLVVLLLSAYSFGTTKIRIHNTASAVSGYQAMDLSLGPAGAAVTTSATTTTSAGNDIQWTATGGGSTLKWITEPLSSTTTISGTITFNFYAKESATSVNSTIRPTLILYHGGAETTTISNCGFATELTAAILAKNWTTASGGWTACSVTSTAIAVGDRLVLKAFVNGCTTTCTVAGGGMAAGTVTVDYDGPTDAADGSSWIQLNETETFSADGGAGGTPAPVQWRSQSQIGGANHVTAGGKYNIRLPNVSQAGNAFIVGCYSTSGTGAITVTDDVGTNNWSAGPSQAGNNSINTVSFYATNLAASTRVISVSPANQTTAWQCSGYEFMNVATASALDVSTGHSTGVTASNSFTAGSFTPANSGDLLFQYGVQDGVFGADSNFTGLSTATQGTCAWKLITADVASVVGAQWCVQGTAAAINPTMTFAASASLHFTSVALALKSSTAGAVHPAGIYVFGEQDTDTSYLSAGVTSAPLQIPTQGNLQLLTWEGDTSNSGISSISSSPSNTWVADCNPGSANGHVLQIYRAANASSSNTETVTATISATGVTGRETIHMLDVIGAATSPFDSAATGTGGPGCIHSNGNVANHNDLSSPAITPSTSNGLIVAHIGVAGGTVVSITTSPQFMSCTFDGELGSDVPCDRNNGYGMYYNPSTSAVTFTWHAGDTTNWGDWASVVAAYKAPSTSTTVDSSNGAIIF